MADETIIDKAMALLPGQRRRRRSVPSAHAARQKQLGAIQKKLAALSKNVEKLAATIAADAKKAVSSKTGRARRPAATQRRRRRSRRRRSAAPANRPKKG